MPYAVQKGNSSFEPVRELLGGFRLRPAGKGLCCPGAVKRDQRRIIVVTDGKGVKAVLQRVVSVILQKVIPAGETGEIRA